MKNKLIILSLLLSGAVVANAQNRDKYYSESWKDNIFISVGVGGQVVTNPDNFDYGFGESITPLINLSLGKNFTPVWGLRGQVAGWSGKLHTQYPFTSGSDYWYNYKKKFVALNIDAMVNLTNLFCGYKDGRKFEFLLFAGPSMNISKAFTRWNLVQEVTNITDPVDGSITQKTEYVPSKSSAEGAQLRALVGASVGLGAKYNINNKWAIDLEARGTVTPSIFGKASDAGTEGIVGVSLGATYTFGGKKFVSCGGSDNKVINQEVNRYREELQQAKNDLVNANNALANAKNQKTEVVKEVVKEVQVAGPRAIFFKLGKAEIDEYGMVNVKLAAKILKANPEKKYKIAGYADKLTGSATSNQKLADKRAQAVYDALVNEGVDKSQLEVVAYGGTDDMFGKDYLNRVVILE